MAAQGYASYRQEKIIFFLDLDGEMQNIEFTSKDGNPQSRFDILQGLLQVFMMSKTKANRNHTYALCGLTEAALEYCTFSTHEVVSRQLSTLRPFAEEFPRFSLDSVFEVCAAKMAECDDGDTTIYRAIVIYGRSHCVPTRARCAAARRLLQSPRFWIDIVYVHRRFPKEGPEFATMQAAFDALVSAEHANHQAYIVECCVDSSKLPYKFGLLLAHPQQRPPQEDFRTSLYAGDLLASTAGPRRANSGSPLVVPGPAAGPSKATPDARAPTQNPLHNMPRGRAGPEDEDPPPP
eukprot:EG_transcript_15964